MGAVPACLRAGEARGRGPLGAARCQFHGEKGRSVRYCGRERIGQEHAAADHCGHPAADLRNGGSERPAFGAAGTGFGFRAGIHGPAERLSECFDSGTFDAKKSTRASRPSQRFAAIGDFIDQPIRTYSTGMVLRLAFAVVAHVDPEILIVDEALAVGDIAFRQRCMRRIHDLRAGGTTILFVSHDTGDVKALCERCLWLENGAVRGLGEADDVIAAYLSAMMQRERVRDAADRIVGGTECAGGGEDGDRHASLWRRHGGDNGRGAYDARRCSSGPLDCGG